MSPRLFGRRRPASLSLDLERTDAEPPDLEVPTFSASAAARRTASRPIASAPTASAPMAQTPLVIDAAEGRRKLEGLRFVNSHGVIPEGGGNKGEHYGGRHPGELDYIYLLFAVPNVRYGGVARDSLPDGSLFVPALDERGDPIREEPQAATRPRAGICRSTCQLPAAPQLTAAAARRRQRAD